VSNFSSAPVTPESIASASGLASCVIFGASGGIGSAVARQIASAGGKAVLAGRTAAKVEVLGAELGFPAAVGDVRDIPSIEACLDQAIEAHGPLTGVACCVGSLLLKPAHLTTDTEWDDVIQQNLTAAFRVLRSSARRMMKSGGSIVLVSSAAGRRGLANHEGIAAAKAGVIGLTLSAAATYAGYGIRVNCVAPGMVRTPLTAALTRVPASLAYSTSLHALGRIGEADEVARALVWLMDARQGWITGQVLGVDGGLASVNPRISANQNS
jgi:NAD(P)-dependent dehydrogenase (short-subunit alcohol dehydrogenase family)